MTDRPDPPSGVLRSLPLAILLGTAASVVVWPIIQWSGMRIFGDPIPPWAVWKDYLTIRVVAGVCAGAAAYAVNRLPDGWLRWCLFWILFFVMLEGDVDDFARWSLDHWLSIWLVGSLIMGVMAGTVLYLMDRRRAAR